VTVLSCREFAELVTAHLDGKLDRDVECQFAGHLAECEGCDRYLDQFRVTIRVLGELPRASLPYDVRDRMLAMYRNWRRS
jgi:anti-sigma factor RsiW